MANVPATEAVVQIVGIKPDISVGVVVHEVARVNIAADTTVSAIEISTSAVIPVAEIECLVITPTGYLDVRGLHRSKKAFVPILDEMMMGIGKTYSESINWLSTFALDFNKPVADLIGFSDAPYISVGFNRNNQETVSFSDVRFNGIGKKTLESVSFIDVPKYVLQKKASETVTFLEVSSRNYSKKAPEGITLTEVYKPTLGKKIPETVTFTDIAKPVLGRKLAEGFGLNESVKISGGTFGGFRKTLSNIFIPTEVSKLTVSKKHADSVTLTDGGTISLQTYADPTYFAQNYVGENTIF